MAALIWDEEETIHQKKQTLLLTLRTRTSTSGHRTTPELIPVGELLHALHIHSLCKWVYTAINSVHPGGRGNTTYLCWRGVAARTLSVRPWGFSQNIPCLNSSDSISVGLPSIYGHEKDVWLRMLSSEKIIAKDCRHSLPSPKQGFSLGKLLRDEWGRNKVVWSECDCSFSTYVSHHHVFCVGN